MTDPNFTIRTRIVRCHIFSVLLYDCECCTLNPATESQQAFEMLRNNEVKIAANGSVGSFNCKFFNTSQTTVSKIQLSILIAELRQEPYS